MPETHFYHGNFLSFPRIFSLPSTRMRPPFDIEVYNYVLHAKGSDDFLKQKVYI
jgi:hypothetical protein